MFVEIERERRLETYFLSLIFWYTSFSLSLSNYLPTKIIIIYYIICKERRLLDFGSGCCVVVWCLAGENKFFFEKVNKFFVLLKVVCCEYSSNLNLSLSLSPNKHVWSRSKTKCKILNLYLSFFFSLSLQPFAYPIRNNNDNKQKYIVSIYINIDKEGNLSGGLFRARLSLIKKHKINILHF